MKTVLGLLIGAVAIGLILLGMYWLGGIVAVASAWVLYEDWLDIVELELPTQRKTDAGPDIPK